MRFPIDHLLYVRHLDGIVDTRHAHAEAAKRGSLHRVARGVYIDATVWAMAKPRERYLALVHAVARTRRSRQVVSHQSAAAIHGLPLIGIPLSVHVTVRDEASRRSSGVITSHVARLFDSDVVEIDGLLVTSVERTLMDVAATSTFAAAVAAMDAGLLVDRWGKREPLTTRERLLSQWEAAQPLRLVRE
jgi:predicted transcriptional regulator of viral defense system